MAQRERERNKHKKKKKSSTFHNLLPNIVSPRGGQQTTTNTQSSQKGESLENMQKMTSQPPSNRKNETDMFNVSQKIATPGGDKKAAIKESNNTKRNLSVGFGNSRDLQITSGGLDVIRDSINPSDEDSTQKIPTMKSLRASPLYDQLMASQSLMTDS